MHDRRGSGVDTPVGVDDRGRVVRREQRAPVADGLLEPDGAVQEVDTLLVQKIVVGAVEAAVEPEPLEGDEAV